MQQHRLNYWLLNGAFFSFFVAWSFSFSFYAIWLKQNVGLTATDIGFVFSINALVAFMLMPFYGYWQDRLSEGKTLLYLVAFAILCCGPFFNWLYQPLLESNFWLGSGVGALFTAVSFGAAVGVLESFIERLSRRDGFEFGRSRMWGSLGWAVATFFTGLLLNWSPQSVFWLSSLAGIIFLFCLIRVTTPTSSIPLSCLQHSKKPGLSDLLQVLKLPEFRRFAFYIISVPCIYQVFDQQFPVYFASMFADPELANIYFGYLNSSQVLLEAALMFVTPALVNRMGARRALILAGCIMTMRILGSGLATEILAISVLKLLHALELPILLIAMFKYIAAVFDPRLSTTLYMVGFLLFSQLSAMVLSPFFGYLYDHYGYAPSYLLIGSVMACCTLLSALLLTPVRTGMRPVSQ
jgi:OHS family lactose permease-like MFS transporter